MTADLVNFIFLWILHMMEHCMLNPPEAINAVITAANAVIDIHNRTGGNFSTYSSEVYYSDNQLVFSSLLEKDVKYTKINDHTIRKLRKFSGQKERYLGEFSLIQ